MVMEERMEAGMLTKLKRTTTTDVLDGDSEGKDRHSSLQEGLYIISIFLTSYSYSKGSFTLSFQSL